MYFGQYDPFSEFESLAQALMAEQFSMPFQIKQAREIGKRCPKCGTSLHELEKSNYFGCSECYQTFASEITDMLQRLHGASSQQSEPMQIVFPQTDATNISPHVQENPSEPLTETAKLKAELKQAIISEDYLRAAEIKRQIAELKEE